MMGGGLVVSSRSRGVLSFGVAKALLFAYNKIVNLYAEPSTRDKDKYRLNVCLKERLIDEAAKAEKEAQAKANAEQKQREKELKALKKAKKKK